LYISGETAVSYEIAQQRIAEARRTNSPRLNLSKLTQAKTVI
jgi:hypothetical protein